METIGEDIVKKLWERITGMGEWLRGKVDGFISGIISAVTSGGSKSSSYSGGSTRARPAPARAAAPVNDAPNGPDMPAPANVPVDGTAGYSLAASDFSRAAAVRALESAIPNAVSRVSVSTAAMAPAGADASTSTVAINALRMEMEGLRRDLNGIKVVMDGRTVGRMVTKQQNNIGRAFGTA